MKERAQIRELDLRPFFMSDQLGADRDGPQFGSMALFGGQGGAFAER
jgi:hypothetical protein